MSEMANTDPEGIDGVRMTWNAWPRTKVDASKCVIPLAACISPIRQHPDVPTLPYAPLRCKICSAVLNPFARVDFTAKIWNCPFCYQRSHFPPHYSMISETNVPAELYPQYTTVQYTLPNPIVNPNNPAHAVVAHSAASPVFVFVLDTCMIEEEFGFVKSALKRAVGLLPENALVGFVSFGTQAHVHELGFSDMSKVYVFRGRATSVTLVICFLLLYSALFLFSHIQLYTGKSMAGVAVKGSLLVVLGLLLVAPMALGRPLEGVVNRINLQAADYIGIVVTSEKVLSELNNNFKPSDHIPEVELAGRKYHIGTLEGANVIIVNSGRHPVNVASAVQALIDNFPIRGIIDVGSAGSLNEKVLEIADVAVPEQVAFTGNWKWQQFEATGGDLTFGTYNVPKSGKNKLGSIVYQKTKFYTPRGTSPDVLYIPVTSNWLKIATNGLQGLELDKCLGTSSSNCLPTSPEIKFELKASASEVYLQNNAYRLFLRNEFGVSSVDETSAAVALASWSNGVEFVIFRGISNYAGGSGSNAAFSELAPVNAVKAVRAFIPLVNRARLAFEY